MKRLMAESYRLLVWIEIVMSLRSLSALYRRVETAKVETRESGSITGVEELCRAMDLACVFYPKRVLCLQRSAALALLLRHHCIHAEMVIGARTLPFKSHAWVEVAGVVVNDKPYIHGIYQEMQRC